MHAELHGGCLGAWSGTYRGILNLWAQLVGLTPRDYHLFKKSLGPMNIFAFPPPKIHLLLVAIDVI